MTDGTGVAMGEGAPPGSVRSELIRSVYSTPPGVFGAGAAFLAPLGLAAAYQAGDTSTAVLVDLAVLLLLARGLLVRWFTAAAPALACPEEVERWARRWSVGAVASSALVAIMTSRVLLVSGEPFSERRHRALQLPDLRGSPQASATT